jgi:hypothetical protein
MGSQVGEIAINVENGRRVVQHAVGETTNPANLNFSIAMISSVYEDRSTCDILLLERNTFRKNIPSTIPAEILNAAGHLKNGDIVLITHKGSGMDCRIIAKLQSTTVSIANDPAIKTPSGALPIGVMSA